MKRMTIMLSFVIASLFLAAFLLSSCFCTIYNKDMAAEDFLDFKQDFQIIACFLLEYKDLYHSVLIDDANGNITFFTLKEDNIHLDKKIEQISNQKAKNAIKNIFDENFVSISLVSKNDQIGGVCYINFSMKGNMSDIYQGIIYSENGIKFIQERLGYELQELSEPFWYYYEIDYS